MTTVHDNEFIFEGQGSAITVSFVYNDEFIVSDGQPLEGVTSESEASNAIIIVKAGRHGTSRCADWFTSFVNGAYSRMIHTLGGDNEPKTLNFAIKGTLTINGKDFDVCLGQGHHDSNNNWHLASDQLTADENAKNGDLGEFRLAQSGSHTFIVSIVS